MRNPHPGNRVGVFFYLYVLRAHTLGAQEGDIGPGRGAKYMKMHGIACARWIAVAYIAQDLFMFAQRCLDCGGIGKGQHLVFMNGLRRREDRGGK